MSNSADGDGGISTYCSHTFNALDKWLIQITNEKNPGEVSKLVQTSFQNNIKANIDYYEYLAKSADADHLEKAAARNRLMVNLYKGFLSS